MPTTIPNVRSRFAQQWARPQVRLASIAVFYLAAVWLGISLVTQPEGISVVWPASGAALAALLLSPRREWPLVIAFFFFVNLAANLIFDQSLSIAAGFALVNALEPALGGLAIRKLCGIRVHFDRLGDMLGLTFVAVIVNGSTAILGALIPVLAFGANFRDTWLSWWILDGWSILTVTPFIMTWVTDDAPVRQPLSSGRRFETAVLLAILCGATVLMFGIRDIDIYLEPNPYMLFPILIWASLRFSPRASATATILMGALALVATLAGNGPRPLGGETLRENLVAVQGFFAVASLATLLLSATINERKQAESLLEQREKRFRALIENSVDAITLLAADGNIVYESPTVERLSGYTADERMGRNGFSNLHPEDTQLVLEAFKRALADPNHTEFIEFRSQRKDGTIWWTEASAINRLADPDVQAIIINYRDITSRKRADEELRSSREVLQRVVNAAPFGAHTYELRPDGSLVFMGANNSANSILGVDHVQFIGKTIEEAFPSLTATDIPAAYRHVASTGETYYQEQIAYDEQGISGAFEVHGVQIGPNAMTAFFRDVTERKKAELERARLMEELERKNKELESLIYIASHDLRSPLVNIQGFGRNIQKYIGQMKDLLEKAPDLDEFRFSSRMIFTEKIPTAMQFIEASSTKMDILIDGLLRVSRVGRAVFQMQAVDMNVLIQNILNAMAFQLEKEGVQMSVAAPLMGCYADPNQISQVFTNLLDNAVKYRSHDRPLKIEISSRIEDRQAVYEVADTGIGIAPENQDKIWELFHRLEGDTSIPGEGLGLTLARRIVEKHGGRIWVQSEPGVGSRFSVKLPVKA